MLRNNENCFQEKVTSCMRRQDEHARSNVGENGKCHICTIVCRQRFTVRQKWPLPSWIRMYSVFEQNFQICITLILCSKPSVSVTVLGEITLGNIISLCFSDFGLFRFNSMIAKYLLFGWPQKACIACVRIFFHLQGFHS